MIYTAVTRGAGISHHNDMNSKADMNNLQNSQYSLFDLCPLKNTKIYEYLNDTNAIYRSLKKATKSFANGRWNLHLVVF